MAVFENRSPGLVASSRYIILSNERVFPFTLIYIRLFILHYAYLQIYRIPFGAHLHRHYLREKVSVVHVHALDIAAVLGSAHPLGQKFAVVHIAGLYTQYIVELFG